MTKNPRIKRILIPIPDYEIFHAPSKEHQIDPKFIGREKQIRNFVTILKSSSSPKGKYLISGARGVGKTSFVGNVIEELTLTNKEKYLHIPITFNEELQTEREVLIQIIKNLSAEIHQKLKKKFKVIKLFFSCIIPLIIVIATILSWINKTKAKNLIVGIQKLIPNENRALVLAITIFAIACLVHLIILFFRNRSKYKIWKLWKEMEGVKNSLNAQKTKESGFTLKGSIFNFKHGVKMNTDILSVKDLESKIARWSEQLSDKDLFKPQLQIIITFDELDKLSLLKNGDSLNDVVHLFSKLKNFLTDTCAKFIFISGVEMHQRFLDTYSDRSNLLISIIDREEQINSFLFHGAVEKAEDVHNTHIFKSIEYYVCKNLKEESKCLQELIDKMDNQGNIKQIAHALYHFINYLCFVSNGNPKKLMIHFEKHLEFLDETKSKINENPNTNLVKWKQEPKTEAPTCYFSLSYSDQLKNSFINYLTSPINFAILKEREQFSDSLLVASSFLLNYIFKYYKNSFSLRNKEQFPEIFQSGNSTDVRELVDQMIHFLSKNHIQPILSSVFRYKLPIKITEEIKNTTKLSEDTSAIFNFTQTEFTTIKDYCNSEINSLKSNANSTEQDLLISSYHHILGDSHLFSDDLNNAIISYRNSSILLNNYIQKQQNTSSKIPYTNFTELIRVQLKLGLAYEKRETYVSAQNLYGNLATLINEYLYIDLKDIDLKLKSNGKYNDAGTPKLKLQRRFSVKEEGEDLELMDHLLSSDYLKHQPFIDKLNFSESVRMITQPLLTRLFIREKILNSEIKLSHIDQTINDFTNIFSLYEMKERFIIPADFYKRMADILFYKNNLGNRLLNNGNNILYFYDLNSKKDLIDCSNIDKEVKGPIINKDIEAKLIEQLNLETSNDHINESTEKTKTQFLERIELSTKNCIEKRKDIVKQKDEKEPSVHKISPSCLACKYYTRSLRYMLRNFSHISYEEIKISSKSNLIFKYLNQGRFNLRSSNYLQTMATTLSSLGDTLLACNQEKKDINKDDEFFEKFIILLERKSEGYVIFENDKYGNSFHKIILYYYLAGRFYAKAGKHSEYMFQLKKILILLTETEYKSPHLLKVSIEILKKIEKCLLSIYGHSPILEEKKLKTLYTSIKKENDQLKSYKIYSSTYADIEDAIYFVKEALIDNEELEKDNCFQQYFNANEQPLTTVYNRMLRLRLNALIHKKEIKSTFDFTEENCFEDNKLKEYIKQNSKDKLDNIVYTIFCLKKFTDFVSKQNNTKLFTNTIIAQVYYDLACWTELLYRLSQKFDANLKNEVNSNLKHIAGIDKLDVDDYKYYYGKAIHYYYKAIEIHSQGQAYQRMIEKMHLLNDDLNDDLFHFFIALERYRINTGGVRYLYDICKRKNNGDSILKKEVNMTVEEPVS